MKNKKQLLIGVGVILLVLLFLLFKPKTADEIKTPVNSESKKEVTENIAENIKGSLADIMKLNKTMKCTFNTETDGTRMTGTTYVSGKNMRMVSEVTNKDKTKISTNMITDGEWAYSWSSVAPQGMKMKLDEVTKAGENLAADKKDDSAKSFKDFENQFDYKCISWNGDSKMFELPKDVQFTDFTSLIAPTSTNTTPGTTPSNNSAMCAACNYAQDADDKAACRAQFNCK